MAKIWCEECSGTGDDLRQEFPTKDCHICHGAGYTEAEVVEVGKLEAAWVDCHIEANSGTDVVMAFNSWLDSLKEEVE